jgi:hypothetical protein
MTDKVAGNRDLAIKLNMVYPSNLNSFANIPCVTVAAHRDKSDLAVCRRINNCIGR